MRWAATVAMCAACSGSPSKLDGLPSGVILSAGLDLAWIDADATHVYFTTADESGIVDARHIGRIPAAGGPPQFLALVPGSTNIASFTMDDTTLYLALEDHRFTLGDRKLAHEGTIRIVSLPKSGGTLATLTETPGLDVDGIAQDRESIYFGIWLDERTHELRAIAKRGGAVRVLHRSTATEDEVEPHRAERETGRGSLVGADERAVYWVSHEDHDVKLSVIDKQRGEVTLRRSMGGNDPSSLTLSRFGAVVAWDDKLHEFSKRSGRINGEMPLMLSGLDNTRVAVDDQLVVVSTWLTPEPRTSRRFVFVYDLDTGTIFDIADSERRDEPLFPVEIAINETGIYVVDEGRHGRAVDTLWRFDRPRLAPQ